jgi:5-methyltetrahydrofolate--homocysteine methyltransferase
LVVVGGGAPVIVGGRLNAADRPALARQLASGNFGLVAREARAQMAAGASVVAVNVGDKEDGAAAMGGAVSAAQRATEVPVSVDSARPVVLEAGLKAAVGKPLLNSCPASARAMSRILPLARRWGAAVVGEARGARGVPTASAARLRLVERFLDRALDEGIALDDIYVDPVMLAAAGGAAAETFESLRVIRRHFGVRTTVTVGNVSQGFRGREVLNAGAFVHAAGAGLDLAVVDPLDPRMQEAIRVVSALTG